MSALTPAQAKALKPQIEAALKRETDGVVRASGTPILKLLGEIAKDIPAAERGQISLRMPHNIFIYNKRKRLRSGNGEQAP